MVLRYERKFGFQYDWITRLRPDLLLLEPMPAFRTLSPQRIYLQQKQDGHIWDVIFVVPRRYFEPFVEAMMDGYDKSSNGKPKDVGFSCRGIIQDVPEAVLLQQLRLKELAWQVYPFTAVPLRANQPMAAMIGGKYYRVADCGRFESDPKSPEAVTLFLDGPYKGVSLPQPVGPSVLNARFEGEKASVWGRNILPNATLGAYRSGPLLTHKEYCEAVSRALNEKRNVIPGGLGAALSEFARMEKIAPREPWLMGDGEKEDGEPPPMVVMMGERSGGGGLLWPGLVVMASVVSFLVGRRASPSRTLPAATAEPREARCVGRVRLAA